MRSWRAKGILFAASLAAAALAGEGFLRLLPVSALQLDLDIYAKEDGVLLLCPNLSRQHVSRQWDVGVRTNSEGWRDDETPEASAVLGLGDSFAFGWGVESGESFYSLIEQRTHEPILNAGVPGTGTLDQEHILELLLRRRRPSAVMLAFFVGNDFTETGFGGAERLSVVDGLLELKAIDGGQRDDGWRRLARRSHVLQLLRATQFRLGRGAERSAPPRTWDGWMREFAQVHLRRPSERATRAVESTLASLDRIAEACRRVSAPLTVIVLPRSFQVIEAEKNELMEALGLDESELDLDRPQRILADWAARNDVPLVDPLAEFRRLRDDGVSLYYSPDAHFTPAGHAAVADVTVRALEGQAVNLGGP